MSEQSDTHTQRETITSQSHVYLKQRDDSILLKYYKECVVISGGLREAPFYCGDFI